jgi:F-type H+-transporting ATPase subunit epsilon
MSQNLPVPLKLKILGPKELLVDEEVQEVYLPSLEGILGIFPGHRALFVALGHGQLTYTRANEKNELHIQGGYAEVLPDSVLVFIGKGKDEKNQPPEGR